MHPPAMNQVDFSYEDRIKLRRWLDDQDQKQAGGMKEFDLAKPPVPPYQYREYPYMMYDHSAGRAKPARNYEERQIMIGQGWSESADPSESQQPIPAPNGERDALLNRVMSMSDEERMTLIIALKAMEPKFEAPEPARQPEPAPEPESETRSRKRQ